MEEGGERCREQERKGGGRRLPWKERKLERDATKIKRKGMKMQNERGIESEKHQKREVGRTRINEKEKGSKRDGVDREREGNNKCCF